jgi:hypothetical protein
VKGHPLQPCRFASRSRRRKKQCLGHTPTCRPTPARSPSPSTVGCRSFICSSRENLATGRPPGWRSSGPRTAAPYRMYSKTRSRDRGYWRLPTDCVSVFKGPWGGGAWLFSRRKAVPIGSPTSPSPGTHEDNHQVAPAQCRSNVAQHSCRQQYCCGMGPFAD